MNLLFMQNGLAPYGIPRNGIVALYDPYKDLYGRNILPVGSENFVTGWTNGTGETCTVTDYPTTINGQSVIAKRIQGNGAGSTVTKYYINAIGGTNPHQTNIACWVKVLSGNVKLYDFSTGFSLIKTDEAWELLTATSQISSTIQRVSFITSLANDILDIVVYQPQANLGALYPYSPPAGLPQSLTDYTGRGNNAQLGSAAGSDTNDPAWSGNGLVFGTDDYCKSSSPAFDNIGGFTVITVCNPITAGGGTQGRIWDKGRRWLQFLSDYTLKFLMSNDTDSSWKSTSKATQAQPNILGMSFNYQTPTVAPSFYIGANKNTGTVVTSGTGSVKDDSTYDLYIGNNNSAIRNFDGTIYCQLWYNRVLSDAEYMSAYNGLRRLMSARGVVI